MIFDICPHPKVSSLTLGCKFYLHSVLLVILVDLICHMIMFEKKKYYVLLWDKEIPPEDQNDSGPRVGFPCPTTIHHDGNFFSPTF